MLQLHSPRSLLGLNCSLVEQTNTSQALFQSLTPLLNDSLGPNPWSKPYTLFIPGNKVGLAC
jgi:hypothetical protein